MSPAYQRDHHAQGEQGFGEGNFRALFESIERQQSDGGPKVETPYLND